VVFYDELQILVDEVANRVDRWTGNTAWVFEPGSVAAAEVANREKRLDGSPWGAPGPDRLPVRADGDQADGGDVALRGIAHRRRAARAGH